MNAKLALALATLAVAASSAARADDINTAQQGVLAFEGQRTRAEVMAEAAKIPATRSNEPAGSRVIAPIKSTVEVQVLRDQAAQAVRAGQISYGEVGRI